MNTMIATHIIAPHSSFPAAEVLLLRKSTPCMLVEVQNSFTHLEMSFEMLPEAEDIAIHLKHNVSANFDPCLKY